MSGGITQLVAVGIQDAYLTGTPEVSFFRSAYKRYTHFAQNVERQILQGNPGTGSMSTLRFEKKGDLLTDVYFTSVDSVGATDVNVNWSQVINRFELLIGGQVIDTQDMTYMSNVEPVVNCRSYSQRLVTPDQFSSAFLPLKFFFCKDWQSALPLVALQYHDIEIRIYWNTVNTSSQYVPWARYIYLDSEEREWFAKNKHDMLISQVVRVPIGNTSTFEFALSQPVRYIAFEVDDYHAVYNGGSSTSVNIPINSVDGLAVGMSVSCPGYINGTTYISSIVSDSITLPVLPLSPIPANTLLNIGPLFSGNFNISTSGSSSTVAVASGTTALSAIPSYVGSGWEVIVSGNVATVAIVGQKFEIQTDYVRGTTLNLVMPNSFTITSIPVTLTFVPPTAGWNSISAISASTLNVVDLSDASALQNSVITFNVASGIGIVTGTMTAVFNAQVSAFAGVTAAGGVVTTPVTCTVTSNTSFTCVKNAIMPTVNAAQVSGMGGPISITIASMTQVTQALATANTATLVSSVVLPLTTAMTVPVNNVHIFTCKYAHGLPINSTFTGNFASSMLLTNSSPAFAAQDFPGTTFTVTSTTQVSCVLAGITLSSAVSAQAFISVSTPGTTGLTLNPVTLYVAGHIIGAASLSMVGWSAIIPVSYLANFASTPPLIGSVTAVYLDGTLHGPGLNIIAPAGDMIYSVTFTTPQTYSLMRTLAVGSTLNTSPSILCYPTILYSDGDSTGTGQSGGPSNALPLQFRMQINGNDIGESRSLPHWVDVNQYYLTPYGYFNHYTNGINPLAIIPFCLDTAKTQPTGSINFSRIDTFRLICPTNTTFQAMSKLGSGSYFYAVNYNILRIQNGMGSVMYSS